MNVRCGFIFALILLFLFSFQTSYAQTVYGSNQYIDAGNPGGINTESDAPGLGDWTEILTGADPVHHWTDVQAIPFTFEYFGNVVTHYMVSQNGLVTFDTLATLLPDDNRNLPTDSLANNTIACYWDYFTGSASGDYIRTKVFGTAPNRQLWIKWYSFGYGGFSFAYNAVVLEETTNSIYLVDQYSSGTSTTTAGIQMNNTTAFQFGDSTISLTGNGSSNTDNDYIEFVILAGNDAGVASIDTPATPYCGSSGLWVTVANYGSATLTSATINWSLNGAAQTPFAWTGSVPSGGTDGPVMISSASFVENDSIAAWTTLPNGGADGNTANDTSSTVVQTGLAGGTYTIGGITGYPTFTAAVNDLNTKGICGPVVFDVQLAASPYVEQIELGEINGTSATNTITFNGNGSTIRWGSTDTDNRHVVRLNGADYVTFNDMTIEVDSDSTYGWGVHLINAADHNTFNNVTVNGDTTSTSSTNFAAIVATGSNTSLATAGNNANYLTINNCTVMGGYYAIRLNGSSSDAMNNTIMNSTIRDFYLYAVYLDDTDGTLVSGNDIGRPNRTSVSTFYGTYLTSGNINCTIEKNYYHNTHGSASSITGAVYLIYFSSCDAPVGQENVAKNNVIYDINCDGTVYAIYNSGSDGAHYYNNTISLDYPSTAGTTRGFYQTTAADNIDFRNNVLTVTRGGSGVKHGLYFATTTSTIISDNNAIYVNPDVNFGRYGTTEYPTFADWRTANGGIYDALSVNADPLYVNLAGGDLTPSSGQVNNIGVSLAEVTEDILGNPRGTPPDPGAYEFDVTLPDVAVSQFINLPSSSLPNSVINFDIEISNVGATAVPADSVDLFLNGSLNSSYGYAALATLEKDTVSASFTASASGSDDILAALRMVAGDGNLLNDTLEASINIDSIYAAPYFEHFDSTTIGVPGILPMGWTNATDDQHDWYVEATGVQNSTLTGPIADHSGTGNYMYVESSSPYFNVTAHLLSPYFDLTGMTAPTVEFWFHMYGQTMGDLHLDVWSSGTGWVNDVRAPLVGEYQLAETDPWLRAGIDLTQFVGSVVQVRFRGITGPNFYSDMSIDDVRLDELANLTPFPNEISAGRITSPLLTKMPLTQTGIVSAVNFEATFTNMGPSNTGDINIGVVDGTTAYSNSTTGVTIPGFQAQTFSFGPWDASSTAADQYNVMMYSSSFAGVNDTTNSELELGETMAWDFGVISTNISYAGAEEVKLGARFTLTDPDTLTSITMMLSTSTFPADSFSVEIYSVANDTPDVMLAQIYNGTYGDFGTPPVLAIFQIPGGMAMPAGDFYAMLITPTPSAASYPLGADGTGLGASALTHRFVARGATSDWLFFEDAGNAAFHVLTPIIRTGYQESGEIHDFAVDSMVVEQVCMTQGETYNVTARIRNVGNQPEGFTTIELHENGLFAGDAFVNSLDPGQSTVVSFPYSPAVSGEVQLDVVSLLTGDGNATNDIATTYVRVTNHDIVFVDDFEDTTFTQANWVIVDDPTSTGTWRIYSTPYPNAYTLPITSSGNVASADADEEGAATITTAMLPLDLSSYDSVFVDFDSDWNAFDTEDTARVNVSNDGGATWTTVLEYVGVDVPNTHVTLDISQYVTGSANAVIAAESYQPGWDWWWTIDNVCVSGAMAAQSPVVYEEVFPDTSVPAGWLVVDNDGSGFAYEFRQQVVFTSGDTVNPESGQSFWFSNYTNANGFLIDEWLISPKIYANSLDELTVYAGAIGGSFPDSLKIWISTTGNDLNSFTNLVAYFLVDGPIGSWHPYTFDISQFSGNDIYVAVNYYIEDGGPSGNNSDNVWVDHIKVTGQPGAPPAAKLLITEIVVTPTSGEFVEIYNPNNESVNLSNFYLTDATFAGDGTYYYKIVEGGGGGGTFGDFDARFPAGAMIGAKEHQTVALAGDSAFFDTYGVMPTYELYEDGHANPSDAPDMLEAVPGSISNQGGLTNGDEVVILYYWDNLSDLVVDVDYLLYNSGSPTANDEAVDKTGVSIDGPDAGTDSSMYLADTPIANQVSALNNSAGNSVQRLDYTEGTQTMSGGNGVTGADETSEDLNNTFTNAYAPTPNDSLIIVGIDDNPLLPSTFAISQNYPNPFNPTTSIKYQLPQIADVTITIYNLLGQKVRTLVNDRKEAGFYEVEWNGLNDHNVQVATGLYIYRIQAADFVQSKKMLLLK